MCDQVLGDEGVVALVPLVEVRVRGRGEPQEQSAGDDQRDGGPAPSLPGEEKGAEKQRQAGCAGQESEDLAVIRPPGDPF
jgi:hypothetical protein